jgi:hypothetical protein
MTEQAISPSRRGMIEDMTIRKFRAEDPTSLSATGQGLPSGGQAPSSSGFDLGTCRSRLLQIEVGSASN